MVEQELKDKRGIGGVIVSHIIDRRSFMKQAAAVAGGSYLAADAVSVEAAGSAEKKSDGASQKLSSYQFGRRRWVRINNRIFTCYRAERSQKYPYLYPVVGPLSGLPMTAETELPWPHHRSLFLGCDRVNGGNYWQAGNDTGQILSRGPKIEVPQGDKVVISDHCDWKQPDQPPVIDDQRRFTISAPSPTLRYIDAEFTLRANVDVHIARSNHSLFAIRVDKALSPSGGGFLINSEGQKGEKATFGQTARWVGFYGTRLGHTECIVLMEHPANPWAPCKWFTRDYGNTSPTIFQWVDKEKGWSLPQGESVRLRYRVLISGGPINVDKMNTLHQQYAASV